MIDGRGGRIVTANLDHFRRAASDADLKGLITAGDLVIADGMPLVWASRIAGRPLPERVAGSDLIRSLSKSARDAGCSVFLLGGRPGAAAKAGRTLAAEFSGLSVAGTSCPEPGFETEPAELERVGTEIALSAPRVVFVALGFPKQDRVIDILRGYHPDAWYVGVGASIDFVAGHVSRAPAWMQRSGTEWIFRLAREPRRLARRYVIHGLPFAIRLFAWALATRFDRA
ncbi:WecB/TagA/CpsF family glycosyltransferase [Patulibacter sp. NPDC049589]|uniref:WecB/TagA/CpsF family glycosyltransferase n=1 Tax=Patulibacter sp. NPDC049589 TaxID=3154731 RepID=UPI00341E6A08